MLPHLGYISHDMLYSKNRFSHSLSLLKSSSLSSHIFTPSETPSATIVPTFQRPLVTEPCAAPPPPVHIDAPDLTNEDVQQDLLQTEAPAAQEVIENAAPALVPLNTHPMQTRPKDGIFKPNPKYGLTAILKEVEPER